MQRQSMNYVLPTMMFCLLTLFSGCAISRAVQELEQTSWHTPRDSAEAVWGRAHQFFERYGEVYTSSDSLLQTTAGVRRFTFSRHYGGDSVEFSLDSVVLFSQADEESYRDLFLRRVRLAREHRFDGTIGMIAPQVGATFDGSRSVGFDVRIGPIGAGLGIVGGDSNTPEYSTDTRADSLNRIEKYKSTGVGFDLKLYRNVLDDRLSLFAEFGYYHHSIVVLGRGEDGEYVYLGNEEEGLNKFGFGGGVVYDLFNLHNFGVGAALIGEVHSIKGLMLGIGLNWLM